MKVMKWSSMCVVCVMCDMVCVGANAKNLLPLLGDFEQTCLFGIDDGNLPLEVL